MKKTLDLGKIDYNNSGVKNCKVTLEVELKEKKEGLILSISGNIWNPRETDILCGGQCIDTIKEFFPNNKKVKRLIEIWEKYHLNYLKAGTPIQEKFINEWKQNNKYDYTAACEALKEAGIYKDNGYKYGSGWLFEEIPQEIIREIENF